MILKISRPTSSPRSPAFRRLPLAGLFGLVIIWIGGCVNVKTPENIVVGKTQPEPIDSGRVPTITTVEQGRTELAKAYQNIRLVEDENRELERDNAKLKRERDEYKSQGDKHD